MLTRLERRALRSLRLVEKVENIGLENIITTFPNSMSQISGGIASRSSSPMAQLTSLKRITINSNNIVNDMHFDRHQIEDLLQKGLQPKIPQTVDINRVHDLPKTMHKLDNSAHTSTNGNIENTFINSAKRGKQVQRQKSRRNVKNGQRADMSSFEGRLRPDLGHVAIMQVNSQQKDKATEVNKTDETKASQQSITQSFVGTVSSMLFGRKGGWL